VDLLKTTDKSIRKIADVYNVSSKTISDINNGYSRVLEN